MVQSKKALNREFKCLIWFSLYFFYKVNFGTLFFIGNLCTRISWGFFYTPTFYFFHPTIFKISKLTLIYYLKRGPEFSLLLFIFFIHLRCWCMQGLCSCAEQGREVGSGLSNVLWIDESVTHWWIWNWVMCYGFINLELNNVLRIHQSRILSEIKIRNFTGNTNPKFLRIP